MENVKRSGLKGFAQYAEIAVGVIVAAILLISVGSQFMYDMLNGTLNTSTTPTTKLILQQLPLLLVVSVLVIIAAGALVAYMRRE